MKIVVRLAIAVLSLGVLWGLLQVLAGESGEVVVLTTTDDTGAAQETRLWVVDHDGSTWLRSGTGGGSAWYQRLVKQPNIEVKRNAATTNYLAKPEPEQRDEINRLINEKYGWADTYIGWWITRADAIPIRLVPR